METPIANLAPVSAHTDAPGRALPYGVVMATAGASALAARCGLPMLTAPLLALAILQAVYIALAGAWRRRQSCGLTWLARWAIGPAHEQAGMHTVPLGLAVICSGLIHACAAGNAAWLWPLAIISFVLTWVLTLVCVGRFMGLLTTRGLRLEAFDGAWFLVPAALLGASIASSNMAEAGLALSRWLALAGTWVGWVGYWGMALLALVRIRRHGVGGVAQAPWWIAMGCAGLAAAALGHLLHGQVPGPVPRIWLVMALLATVLFAVALCVPIGVGSARFLLCRCRFRSMAAWPPTFSTAVFAFGCLQAGDILSSSAFRHLGFAAACVTLAFWAVSASWNVTCRCAAWLRQRRTGRDRQPS